MVNSKQQILQIKKYLPILLAILLISCSSGSDTSQSNETSANQQTEAAEENIETVKEPTMTIWMAAQKGNVEVLQQHIAYGTDLESKGGRRDETALIIAACQGHTEAVSVLVSSGADIDATNNEDVTPLFCATFFGWTEVVKFLFDSGADPNIVMNQDLTAMSLVSAEWNSDAKTAVQLYKIKYDVKRDIDEVEEAHPFIMEILNGEPAPSQSTESASDSTTENGIVWGEVVSDFGVYAAPDVTQEHIDITVEWVNKGIELWGNHGPLELWIVGKSKDGARALDDIWCDVRVEKDPSWNTEWDCLNGDPYGSGDGWSPFYRCPDEGCSQVSGYIKDSLGYYFNALTMSSKYPGPEEDDYKKVVLHEYFHVYQATHISQPEIDDGDGDWMTSNRNYIETADYVQRPWITEGGAEYMATYWYSKQSGVSEGYFEERMRWKAESLPGYLSDGRSMREVGFYENISWDIYDVGTWFVAYIINQTSEETFRVDYYDDLEALGFEAAFEKHFGKSADAMIEEFNAWANQPVDALLEILP